MKSSKIGDLLERWHCPQRGRGVGLLFVWLLVTQPATAADFLIDDTVAANPTSYGIVFDTIDASITVNSGNFVLNISGPSPMLLVRYLTIKPKQRWKHLIIDATNVAVSLSGPNGEQLLSFVPVSGVQTFDISDKTAARNGEVLTMTLVPFMGNQINSIRLTYEGTASLLCYPSPWTPGKGNLQLSYELEDDARVNLRIYDNTGRMVAVIRDEELLSGKQYAKQNDSWQGRTLSGSLAASGVYHAVVQVKYLRQDYSSYESRFRFVIAR